MNIIEKRNANHIVNDKKLSIELRGRLKAILKENDTHGEIMYHIGREELLFKAASNNDLELVEKLLKEGATLYCKIPNFRTPLQEAVCNNNLYMIEALVNKGADVNYEDADCTILELAKAHGDDEIIEFLKDNGAKLKRRTK